MLATLALPVLLSGVGFSKQHTSFPCWDETALLFSVCLTFWHLFKKETLHLNDKLHCDTYSVQIQIRDETVVEKKSSGYVRVLLDDLLYLTCSVIPLIYSSPTLKSRMQNDKGNLHTLQLLHRFQMFPAVLLPVSPRRPARTGEASAF